MRVWGAAHQLRVEFGQARLAIVVEDKDGVDHCGYFGRGIITS